MGRSNYKLITPPPRPSTKTCTRKTTMSSIVGGFYLDLKDSRESNKASRTQPRFWLDLLMRALQLEPSCILLIGNNPSSEPHCTSQYSIGCASHWQLTTTNLSSPITLQGFALLAGHIALHGFQNGLSWKIKANHDYDAPLHLLDSHLLQQFAATAGKSLPCIPISLHSQIGVSMSFDDCLTLGRQINQAVRDQHSNERVLVVACHSPVVWPTKNGPGTYFQQDLLSRVIERADVSALHKLHRSVLDSHTSRSLELLACTLTASAGNNCQWLCSEDGRNGIQITSELLQSNKSPRFLSEYEEFVVESTRRRTLLGRTRRMDQPAIDDGALAQRQASVAQIAIDHGQDSGDPFVRLEQPTEV